jgi:hypothetical protein
MEHRLVPHPRGAPLGAPFDVFARAELIGAGTVRFEYRLTGDVAKVAIPARQPSRHADRLWERTCFEAFVASSREPGYCELNFSPSTQWAAYEFDGHRLGMRALVLAPPAVAVEQTARELRVTATVELGGLAAAPWPRRVGLTAVIQEQGGGRGYFALRHPREKPDFHDAEGFAVLLDGSAR